MLMIITVLLTIVGIFRLINIGFDTWVNREGGLQENTCIDQWKGDVGYEISCIRFVRDTS